MKENISRSPLFAGLRRKKTDRGQRSAFPSETSRFAPLILAHRSSALPCLLDDRTALRPHRIWCVPPDRALPGSPRKCSCLSRAATKLDLERGEHLGTPSSTNHTAAAFQPIVSRKDSQLAAFLEGDAGLTPAGKTIPHSYTETSFRREKRGKRNTFHSSGQTSNILNWKIDELKVSKRHAVAFQIDYSLK